MEPYPKDFNVRLIAVGIQGIKRIGHLLPLGFVFLIQTYLWLWKEILCGETVSIRLAAEFVFDSLPL